MKILISVWFRKFDSTGMSLSGKSCAFSETAEGVREFNKEVKKKNKVENSNKSWQGWQYFNGFVIDQTVNGDRLFQEIENDVRLFSLQRMRRNARCSYISLLSVHVYCTSISALHSLSSFFYSKTFPFHSLPPPFLLFILFLLTSLQFTSSITSLFFIHPFLLLVFLILLLSLSLLLLLSLSSVKSLLPYPFPVSFRLTGRLAGVPTMARVTNYGQPDR